MASAPPPPLLTASSGGGALLYVWVPAVACGHALALYWLLRGLLQGHPLLVSRIKARLSRLVALCCCKPAPPGANAHDGLLAAGKAPSPTAAAPDRKGKGAMGIHEAALHEVAISQPAEPISLRQQYAAKAARSSFESASGDASSSGHGVLFAPLPPSRRSSSGDGGGGRGGTAASPGLPLPEEEVPASAVDAFSDGEGDVGVDETSIRMLGKNVQQVSLEWTDLGIQYHTPQGLKTVLAQVSGAAPCRSMMALIGPSGAGKSTLLDILAMRPVRGRVSGTVLVNGRERDTQFLQQSAYVPQEDNFLPQLTVDEVLTFYARMVMPLESTTHAQQRRVREVLAALGLANQRHTLMGGVLPGGILLRGVSGGERKRVNIAAGILAQPSVVFLDEPTSGLDSFAALSVMVTLRHMALVGHTIITSIHQPRAAIWNMFDRVLLLSKGLVMYEGMASGLVPWFTDVLGYEYDPERHGVASDWVMDLVCVGFDKTTAKGPSSPQMMSLVEVREAAALFRRHYLRSRPRPVATPAQLAAQGGPVSSAPTAPSSSPAPLAGTGVLSRASRGTRKFLRDYVTLWRRESLVQTRNPADAVGRILLFMWVGLISNILNYNLSNDANSIRLRIALLFAMLFFYMVMPFPFMSLFTADKKFFLADSAGRLYKLPPYYLAKLTATMPYNIITALVFGWIGYGMLGLRHSFSAFAQTSVFFALMGLIALQWVYFATAISANQDLAFSLSIAFAVVNIVVCGFFLSAVNLAMPWILRIKYISALDYAFQGVLTAELKDRLFYCGNGVGTEAIGLFPAFIPQTPKFVLVRQVMASPGAECVADTNALLSYFDVHTSVGRNVGCLLGYLAVLHIATYLALRRAMRRRSA